MKIAVVSAFLFDDCIGGAENHIRFMCSELERRGHQIVIFKPVFGESARPASRIVDGLEIRYVATRSDFDPRLFAGGKKLGKITAVLRKLSFGLVTRQLCAAIDDFMPDVVWQHDFLSSWLACRVLSNRYPVVLTNHQGQYILLNRSTIGRNIGRYLLSHYDAVIGPSRELTPDDREHSYMVPNGVDTSLFTPLPENEIKRLRTRLYGGGADLIHILCPRRWAPTKGIAVFMQAVAELLAARADLRDRIRVLFAGNDYAEYPYYRKELLETLPEIGCECRLLGNPDVYGMVEHYQCADVVVIPSFLEAVSLAALEAMACECAVVSSAVGGMTELISQDETGCLVPAGDSRFLAAALARLIDDQPLRRRLGTAARAAVESEFSWTKAADMAEAVLHRSILCRPGLMGAPAPWWAA